MSFAARLHAGVSAHGRLCVGIDPHPHLLQSWGLSDDAAGLERCARTMVAAGAGRVAIMKPQAAFFERHGSAGIVVLERVLADARDAGVLMLLDVKRGDIGSTMAAYAHAYLADDSALRADAITVSPYLGVGALEPAFTLAAQSGRGLFVLARTSNPEGTALQQASSGDRSVAQQVVDEVAAHNPADAAGSFGLVVGATIAPGELDLSRLNGPVLAPGYGAQGGDAASVARIFADVAGVVLPSSSRAVMAAGPAESDLAAAIERTQAELA